MNSKFFGKLNTRTIKQSEFSKTMKEFEDDHIEK